MPIQIRRAPVNKMFTEEDLIFSYTTKEAVEDGSLIKIDQKTTSEAAIRFPVYFTQAAWDKYVKVSEGLTGCQDIQGRLWDILFSFAWKAKSCNESVLNFKFNCQIPNAGNWERNEKKSKLPFNFREVTLKAVITGQDVDDPSPDIFIMKPWKD